MRIYRPGITPRLAADIFAADAFSVQRRVDPQSWTTQQTDGVSGPAPLASFKLIGGQNWYDVWQSDGERGYTILQRTSPIAKQIIEGLQGFADAIVNDECQLNQFRITKVVRQDDGTIKRITKNKDQ